MLCFSWLGLKLFVGGCGWPSWLILEAFPWWNPSRNIFYFSFRFISFWKPS
jgi:hypothetical protein